MPRPTPARLLYLAIGLVLGVILTYVASRSIPLPGAPVAAQPTPAFFTGTALDRVLPINASAERSGATVRLNALELYTDGVRLTYTVLGGRNGMAAPLLDVDTFQMTDDRGTAYALSPFVGGSIPTAGYTSGYVAFSPAMPREARTLKVAVPHLVSVGSAAGQRTVIDGPWEFQIPVR